MVIQVRTLSPVTNADIFNGADAKVMAELRKIDLISNEIVIFYNIERPDGQGGFTYERFKRDRKTFGNNQLDAIFNLSGEEITTGESFVSELAKVFAEGFRRLIGNQGLFGLSQSDWEILAATA